MPWEGMELRMRLVNALVAAEDRLTALCEEYVQGEASAPGVRG